MADVRKLLERLRSARQNDEIVAGNDEALGLLGEIEGLLADQASDPLLWSIGCHMHVATEWFYAAYEEPPETMLKIVLGDSYEAVYEAGVTDEIWDFVLEAVTRRVIRERPHEVGTAVGGSFDHHFIDGVWDQMNTAVTDYASDALVDLADDDEFWTEQLAMFRAAHPEAGTSTVEAETLEAGALEAGALEA
jgi:hypothetical protein